MGPTVTLRSRASQTLGIGMVVVAVALLGAAALDGVLAVARYGAPLVLFGVLGWAAFWRPCVEISDGGVRLVNTWRTVHVPWPAIESVDGRYGLRLRTAYGSLSAWAAGAPSGRGRAVSDQSEAAHEVLTRLEALRSAGHLEDPRLERARPQVSWHLPVVAAVAVLGLGWALQLLLG